jgi:phage tail-like protein
VRLEELLARSHPGGNRIDLTWANLDPAGFPGVRVVRRQGTFPVAPDDGVIVAHGASLAVDTDDRGRALHRVADLGLQGDAVYYYAVFPYRGDPPEFEIDRANRAAALASTPHGAAGRMYALLPAIYRRYDADHEQLRRLLELPGGELDLLQSLARAVLDAHDPRRVDGRLLPLLADWIGWKTDHRLELERQRNEIRDAPAIYRRVGLLPVVGATVKRISGWESRSKEFVHNIARSNRPARLNLWARRIAADGEPAVPAGTAEATPDALISLQSAYGGRPAAVTDEHGVRCLFDHTRRRDGWRLAHKSSPTFALGARARAHLDAPDIARLQDAFAAAGVALAADAVVSPAGSLWHLEDATHAQRYVIEEDDDALLVYHITTDPLAPGASPALPSPSLAPSRLVTAGGGGGEVDERDPAAVLQGETLWLFWSTYDRAAGRWALRYRTRRDGRWSEPRDRLWEDPAEQVPERRAPAVAVDHEGGLWLFWLERTGRRWVLRYNCHDGSGLDTDPSTGWQLDPPVTFPAGPPGDPRVEGDAFVLCHPDDAARRVWLFWARKEPAGEPGQTRWSVAYRVKAGTVPDAADWGDVELLPKPDPLAHDREPAARVDEDGNVLLFWSSDRDGGWSVVRATLDLGAAPPAWQDPARVTDPPYWQRDPLPIALDGETLLIYRSNESLPYASDVYRATRTMDFRYAGSTTAHVRDAPRLALRGAFDDVQHYTFDTGAAEDDWYRRDTIGVYLEPDTLDAPAVERGLARLARVLPEFMPATDRAVFVHGRDLHVEHVYTYDAPGLEPWHIGESYADALTLSDDVVVLGPGTDFDDDLE